jgi:hypothetical protein
MENDTALDWLASEVEAPLLATIRRTLHAFLEQTQRDDVKMMEAEAAAALLVDLTGGHAKMKYTQINSSYLAKQDGLWSLAATVITRIIEDTDWLGGWNEPQEKLQVLRQLLSDLHRIQGGSESG